MADKKVTFADEINNRLGDFFGDIDTPDVPARDTKPAPQKNSDLFDLQAIILSIEWEISDVIMKRLIAEIDRLMKIYQGDKVVNSLLKLLDSVGKYINAKKATAHPDSIKLLHSIHANLQKVANSEDITESQSNQILSAEMAKFKDLKQKLLTETSLPPSKDKKTATETKPTPPKTAPPKTAAPVKQPQPPTPGKTVPTVAITEAPASPMKDPVLQAIDELKNLIKVEFASLREELKKQRR